MKLLTYRLNQKLESLRGKLEFMNALWQNVLYQDNSWHYFFDPEGVTLRFQPKYELKVRKWLKKEAKLVGITFEKHRVYIPKKHEYYGVKFIGDDLLPLFHEMSVLVCKYPPYIILRPIHERLNHGIVNMCGEHDFAKESELYLNLAVGRASLINYPILRTPKWVYKLFLKIQGKFRKQVKYE